MNYPSGTAFAMVISLAFNDPLFLLPDLVPGWLGSLSTVPCNVSQIPRTMLYTQ